jgi:hypothetical protein
MTFIAAMSQTIQGTHRAATTEPPGPCNSNYETEPGTPCVPGGDYDCSDLALLGVVNIEVIGIDQYRIDIDGDKTACEGSVLPKATAFGADVADNAGLGILLTVPVILFASAYLIRWAARLYRESTVDEKRGHQMSIALTLLAAFPVAILGALIFSLIGIE